MNKENKLKQFFTDNIKGDLKKNLVLETSQGGFTVFGKYNIDPVDNGFKVQIIKDSFTSEKVFSDKKIALCWCVFEKFKSYREVNRIPNLDAQLLQISCDIKVLRQKISKTKDAVKKDIYYAKLQEAKYKKSVLLFELQEYIVKSSIWQIQEFDKLEHSTFNKN
jgi:hypothetical protein